MIDAKILLHSRCRDNEIITWELTYPRFIHSELMTHRVFSRNSASSRAIPVKETLRAVWRNPAVPVHWGANQSGMQAKRELEGLRLRIARRIWLLARLPAIVLVWLLTKVGLHKQVANRMLEPWLHMTIVMTATEHENWFKLRNHGDAQPEIHELAAQMWKLRKDSEPYSLRPGDWHIPLLTGDERAYYFNSVLHWQHNFPDGDARGVARETSALLKTATARCARASYIKHDQVKGKEADRVLHDKLKDSGHWSPFEHCAVALETDEWIGNFQGFKQYRKFFDGESGRSRA